MELLAGLFSNLFAGGATGLLGAAIQRYADYKNAQLQKQIEQQRGEQELAKRRLDHEIAKSEYEGKLRIAQEEGATAREVAETQAFSQSILREPERYSHAASLTPAQQWVMVLLDAFRGAVRPLLTVYFCALTTYVWIQVRAALSTEDLDATAAIEVWKMVVGQILYLTTSITLWWFGTRNKQKQPEIRLPR